MLNELGMEYPGSHEIEIINDERQMLKLSVNKGWHDRRSQYCTNPVITFPRKIFVTHIESERFSEYENVKNTSFEFICFYSFIPFLYFFKRKKFGKITKWFYHHYYVQYA